MLVKVSVWSEHGRHLIAFCFVFCFKQKTVLGNTFRTFRIGGLFQGLSSYRCRCWSSLGALLVWRWDGPLHDARHMTGGGGAAEGVWSGNPPYTRLLWARSSTVFFLWLACCSVSGGFAWEFLFCSTKDQSLQSKQRPSSLERPSALPSSYTYKTVALKKKYLKTA